jgi:dienelactone hydrolase
MRFLIAAFLLLVSALRVQKSDSVKRLDYDHSAPLDVKETSVKKKGDVSVHDISYVSPKGGRVPAYLVVPEGKGPFAAVIWGHWYWSNSPMRNRSEFLDEAIVLARSGVVSLLPDGPIARPGHVENKSPLSDAETADLVQAIVDMRRSADLLQARGDVDPTRLAYVGHSYNAAVGAFLSGIDKRFRSFVLMAGGLSDASDLKSAELRKYREKVGTEKFDAYMAKTSWLDPGLFVSHAAPATVFLQYGAQETFLNPERARVYANLVSEPKQLKIYDAPHALNKEARKDRIAFLCEQLKLKLPDPAAVAGVPELYQPPEETEFAP